MIWGRPMRPMNALAMMPIRRRMPGLISSTLGISATPKKTSRANRARAIKKAPKTIQRIPRTLM